LNDYEVTYILRPNFEEADVETRATAIGEIIKGLGGEIVAIEKLGKKRLAYEIKDLREGNYVAMQYRSTGEASQELERLLKLNEDVLRHLVIALDKTALAHMATLAQQAAMAPPPMPAYERGQGGYDRPERPQAGGYDRSDRPQAPYERT
jgi:small subunit ribosomal protein S6